MSLNGTCLCGTVSYEITRDLKGIVHCHCQTCRKAHGSAFSSVSSVLVEDFHLTGKDNLTGYESSLGKVRYFCKTCGSQIYAKRSDVNHIILRMGTLDSATAAPVLAHIWMSNKATWYDPAEQVECLAEGY